MATWLALLAFAMGVVTLRRWVWRPLRARRRSYLIEQVRPVSGNAITVVVRAQGHRGLPFHAGQFAWLKIGTSPFVFEEHPFTIASTAEQPQRMEFTIKALGDSWLVTPGRCPASTSARRTHLRGVSGDPIPSLRAIDTIAVNSDS